MNSIPGSGRCAAAHPHDRSTCHGPTDAVRIVDHDGAHTYGCVHHAATMLASLTGGRVYPGSVPGAAIDAHLLAAGRQPFDFTDYRPTAGDATPVDPGGSAGVGGDGRLVLPLDADHGITVTPLPATGGVRLVVRSHSGITTVTLTRDQAATVADALTAAIPLPASASPPNSVDTRRGAGEGSGRP